VIGSHDAPRIAARLGEAQARVAAILLLTLRGTPTLYQGDELGIGKVTIPPDRIRDPQDLRQPGMGLGRDRSRTPMPWDGSANAGFSTAEPWLPLNGDWPLRNVQAQQQDSGSMLSLYRQLLRCRRESSALALGAFELVAADSDLLVYDRFDDRERVRVALNLAANAIKLPFDFDPAAHLLVGTHPRETLGDMLRPNEGIVFRLVGPNAS
jgi:oligo-1,6-glucosidase/alpha-glucosidase